PSFDFRKVRPAQVRLFRQLLQSESSTVSAGADVFSDDLSMLGGMSHSISKPESDRDEHSTYRMFKLDRFSEIGIDPLGWRRSHGVSEKQAKPLQESGRITDLIKSRNP